MSSQQEAADALFAKITELTHNIDGGPGSYPTKTEALERLGNAYAAVASNVAVSSSYVH